VASERIRRQNDVLLDEDYEAVSDPEELRDVIRNYQYVCSGAVSRFDGHIAK